MFAKCHVSIMSLMSANNDSLTLEVKFLIIGESTLLGYVELNCDHFHPCIYPIINDLTSLLAIRHHLLFITTFNACKTCIWKPGHLHILLLWMAEINKKKIHFNFLFNGSLCTVPIFVIKIENKRIRKIEREKSYY